MCCLLLARFLSVKSFIEVASLFSLHGSRGGFHDWGNVYLENSDISYLVYSIFGLA